MRLVSFGNEQAFTELFRKYSGLLYSFLYEHLDSADRADDLVQDIFTKIWLARESLSEIRQFRSFLFVLARNHAMNEIKKRLREKQRNLEWCTIQPDTENEEEHHLCDANLDIVEQAIEKLPGQQKKVWILSRRKAMKYAEIAEAMNLSKETVKKYIQYANHAIMKSVSSRLEIAIALGLIPFF